MTVYRLVIQDVTGGEVFTSYTRWLECVKVKEGPEQEVYVTFSPRFERIWLESRKAASSRGIHVQAISAIDSIQAPSGQNRLRPSGSYLLPRG
jgi:hypothetical protein